MTRIFTVLAGVVALALVGAACATDEEAGSAPPETLAVTATDYAFALDDTTIAPGRVNVTIDNKGKEAHQAVVARIDDGKTIDDVLAALEESEAAFTETVAWKGGPSAVDPGLTATTSSVLSAGSYVLVCFVPSPDGAPHFAKGMTATLTVEGQTTTAAAPVAAGTFTVRDFAIDVPEGFAGQGTYALKNEGPEPHEITLVRLASGKRLEDVLAWLGAPNGPPPFAWVGGVAPIDAGDTAWIDLDLAPGSYAALCFVESDAHGKRHLQLGMATPFTVG